MEPLEPPREDNERDIEILLCNCEHIRSQNESE